MLRWAAHDRLEPACGTCLRALTPGVHRRRAATHILGLAALPLEALDLEDLADAGLLLEHPPRPEPQDWSAEVAAAINRLAGQEPPMPVVLSEDVLGGSPD